MYPGTLCKVSYHLWNRCQVVNGGGILNGKNLSKTPRHRHCLLNHYNFNRCLIIFILMFCTRWNPAVIKNSHQSSHFAVLNIFLSKKNFRIYKTIYFIIFREYVVWKLNFHIHRRTSIEPWILIILQKVLKYSTSTKLTFFSIQKQLLMFRV